MRVLTSLDPRALLNRALYEIQDFTDRQTERRAYLLVPEGLKAEAERRYLEKVSVSGLMMAEVLSFRRLAERLLLSLGSPGQSLTPFAELLTLRRLIQASPERYPKLSRLSWSSHNLTEILSVLGDFQRQNVSPTALQEISRTVPLASSQAKLTELSALYSDYRATLAARQSYPLSDLIQRMADRLQHSDEAMVRATAYLDTAQFWLVGYGDVRLLTQAELALLSALATRGAELTVALPLAEPGAVHTHGASQLAEETLRQLYELPVGEVTFVPVPDGRHPAAIALSRYLVDNPPTLGDGSEEALRRGQGVGCKEGSQSGREEGCEDGSRDGQGGGCEDRSRDGRGEECKDGTHDSQGGETRSRPFDYGLVAAPDRFMAAEFLAGEIKRLVLSGVRRKHIAVAVLEPSDERLLRQVLHDFGLETDLSLPTELKDSALYLYLRGLFAIQAGERRIRELIPLLRSVLRPEGLTREALDRLENLALAQGWRWWSELQAGLAPADAALAQSAEIITELVEQLATLPSAGTGAELVTAWQDALNGRLGTYAALERALEAEGFAETGPILARAWQALGQIFSEIQRLEPLETMSAEAFYELVLTALSTSLPPTIPQGLDRVHLLPLRALLQKEVDYLFLFHSSESSLPPPPPAEGLLNTAEREWLKHALGQNFPNFRQDLPASNHYLLAQVFALPQRALAFYHCQALSWTGAALEGEHLSPYEQRLLKLQERTVQLLEHGDLPDQRALGQSSRRRLLALHRERWPEAVLAAWQPPLTGGEWQERAVALAPSLNKTGEIRLQEAALGPFVTEGLAWSASSLENLAACPYQSFMAHILKAKERYEVQPDASQIGTFVHRLLELLGPELTRLRREIQDLPELDLKSWREWRLRRIGQEIIGPLYRQAAREAGHELWLRPETYGHEGLRLMRNLTDFAAVLARDQVEGYELWRREWRFPSEGASVTLPFDYAGEERRLELRGIIDRVDAKLKDGEPQQVAIYDYKTGQRKSQENRQEVGLELQLPLYIYACQQLLPGVPVTAAELLNFRDERPQIAALQCLDEGRLRLQSSGARDPASCARLADQGAELASQTLTQFYAGDISARPRVRAGAGESEGLPCQYCPFKASCGYDRRQIRRRVQRIEAPLQKEEQKHGDVD